MSAFILDFVKTFIVAYIGDKDSKVFSYWTTKKQHVTIFSGMATFSQKVKSEIIKSTISLAPCCKLTFLSGIICSAASITLGRGGLGFELSSENLALMKTAARFAEQLYGAQYELVQESGAGRSRTKYRLTVADGEQILTDCGVLGHDDNGLRQITVRVDEYLTGEQCCRQAFVKAVFLGAGYVTLPEENNKEGYHLEFALSQPVFASGFESALHTFGFAPKKILRKNETVLYWKGSEEISDMIAFLGAPQSVFRLQNTIAERAIRNRANRQTNCISANIDKTIEAAEKQLESIRIIEQAGRFDALPQTLKTAAELRKAYPSDSLDELAALSAEDVTKSGLNHRFRRLREIATSIKNGGAL